MAVITTHGYRAIFLPNHPMAASNGYVYEHRLVMANYLGRILERYEHVHHKDGNKTNNDIKNLEIVTDSEHKVKHRTVKTKKLRMPGEPNPTIECACGCGAELKKYDKTNRPRKFISGHNAWKYKDRQNPTVECACGCGAKFNKYNKYGQKRICLTGHRMKKNGN